MTKLKYVLPIFFIALALGFYLLYRDVKRAEDELMCRLLPILERCRQEEMEKRNARYARSRDGSCYGA